MTDRPTFQVIGEGYRKWPYSVFLDFDNPRFPLQMWYGSGHMETGGGILLQELLSAEYDTHLDVCGCLWLHDLAREEQERGTPFTATEIEERWKARNI
jgi:hypothetical protein